MNTFAHFWKDVWYSILVALGYMAGLIFAGIIGAMLGQGLPTAADKASDFVLLFVASTLLGLFLGLFASHLALSRGQHFILWASLILFNMGSVAIEGAYFAPDLVSISVPMLVVRQLLAAGSAAFVITWVFALPGPPISWKASLRTRPWYSWVWRFIVSAISYFVFYFVFGGLNYQLVTKPFYESHAGGLTVPAPNLVFTVELIRSVIIVFSVLLFLLSARRARRQLMVSTGWLLFALGGIVPLVWQFRSLPLVLLAASAVEIFFQNFLTGMVAARLMGIEDTKGESK